MSETDLHAKFQQFPDAVREKVDTALSDAKIALKLKAAEVLADKAEMAEHASPPPAGSAPRAVRCPS